MTCLHHPDLTLVPEPSKKWGDLLICPNRACNYAVSANRQDTATMPADASRSHGDVSSGISRTVGGVTFPYPPQANHFKTPFCMSCRQSKGVRMILSEKAREFKETAAFATIGSTMQTGPVSITVNVYRPRKTGDLDNVLKLAIDSLTGTCIGDDEQIVEIHAFRHDDKKNPRVEVEVNAARQVAAVVEEGGGD